MESAAYGRSRPFNPFYEGYSPDYRTRMPHYIPHRNMNIGVPFYIQDDLNGSQLYECSPNYKAGKSGSISNLNLMQSGQHTDRYRTRNLHSINSKFIPKNFSPERNNLKLPTHLNHEFNTVARREKLGQMQHNYAENRRFTVPDYNARNNFWYAHVEDGNHSHQNGHKYLGPYDYQNGKTMYESTTGSAYFSPQKSINEKLNGVMKIDQLSSSPTMKIDIHGGAKPIPSTKPYSPSGYSTENHTHLNVQKMPTGHILTNGTSKRITDYQLKSNRFHGSFEEVENATHGPISPHKALQLYHKRLSQYERNEILNYSEIYFLGLDASKIGMGEKSSGILMFDSSPKRSNDNYGYDDPQSGYKVVLNDHIAYRYEITKLLGKGSFGQVVQAHDHKMGTEVALKIIRSEDRFARQAKEEIRILQTLNDKDIDGNCNIVRLLDNFVFRNHVCMVFELLNLNLYEILQRNDFRGLSQGTVSKLTRGILECLNLLFKNNIIHCDLKPENVLLRSAARCAIKVIDFGSSCYADQRVYTYIQSRFYRAPEIILGMEYGPPIDMWSLGCIVAEMITGTPLFPGENEADQLARIMEVLGVPPKTMLTAARRANKFFTLSGEPLYAFNQTNGASVDYRNGHTSSSHSIASGRKNGRGPRALPGSIDLLTALTMHKRSSVCMPGDENMFRHHARSFVGRVEPVDVDLLDFLDKCFQWLPERRMNPIEALNHPWISKRRVTSSVDKKLTQSPPVQLNEVTNGLPKVPDIPDSVRANFADTDELLHRMQNVRVRKPASVAEDDIRPSRRYSQYTKGERSHIRGIRRFSSSQETLRHLMEPMDVADRNRTPSSRNRRDSTSRNYREFISNGGEKYSDMHCSSVAHTDDEAELYRRHRPRRPSNRQRDSLILRVDDYRSRRLSGVFDPPS